MSVFGMGPVDNALALYINLRYLKDTVWCNVIEKQAVAVKLDGASAVCKNLRE